MRATRPTRNRLEYELFKKLENDTDGSSIGAIERVK